MGRNMKYKLDCAIHKGYNYNSFDLGLTVGFTLNRSPFQLIVSADLGLGPISLWPEFRVASKDQYWVTDTVED